MASRSSNETFILYPKPLLSRHTLTHLISTIWFPCNFGSVFPCNFGSVTRLANEAYLQEKSEILASLSGASQAVPLVFLQSGMSLEGLPLSIGTSISCAVHVFRAELRRNARPQPSSDE